MGNADISGKRTISIYNEAWVRWLLQEQEIEVEAELSGEFQFVARASDSLLKVHDKDGNSFLSLAELQLRFERKMSLRLSIYAGLGRYKYNLPVHVTVIYLLPAPDGTDVPTAFHAEFMGQVGHQDFQVIRLWELEAEAVLAFNNPALLPFVPLMRGGGTEEVLRRCAARIREEPSALELETILAMFASYVLDNSVIKRILRWEMQIVKESPILQEVFKERFEEGHRVGKKEATLESLYQVLSLRFQMKEVDLVHMNLAQLDLEWLQVLHEVAITASSWAEFEATAVQFGD